MSQFLGRRQFLQGTAASALALTAGGQRGEAGLHADAAAVVEPQREVPVADKVDVVVCGAGPAGVAAAVAAARAGVLWSFAWRLVQSSHISAHTTYAKTQKSVPSSPPANASVLSIAVHPEFRRRGIASQLIDCFQQDAQQRGVTEVWLTVVPDNRPARKLYERAGWQTFNFRDDLGGVHYRYRLRE